MPVHLPILGERIDLLSACASVNNKAKAAFKNFAVDGRTLLDCRSAPQQFSQFLLETFSDGDLHIHVNIASRRYFRGRRTAPKRLVDMDVFTGALSKYIGTKADSLTIVAEFRVPRKSIGASSFVNTLSDVSLDIGDAHLKIRGMELAIDKAPYKRLSWKSEEKWVTGQLSLLHKPAELTPSYLVQAFAGIETGIDRFVLEREPKDRG